MAVERMKLLSIVGKEEHIDPFISRYLLTSGLQPENALKVFDKGWKLSYFSYDNTAIEQKKKCQEMMQKLGIELPVPEIADTQIKEPLEKLTVELEAMEQQIRELTEELECKKKLKQEMVEKETSIAHLKKLNIPLGELFELRYMRFRYGKISKENYEKVKAELDTLQAIVLDVEEGTHFVWILYITTQNFSQHVDSFFNIAKFERIWIPPEISGKPKEFLEQVNQYLLDTNQAIARIYEKLEALKYQYETRVKSIYQQLELYVKVNQVKKYMAHDNKGNFYIVGWIPKERLEKMLPSLMKEQVEYVVKSHDEVADIPPTHLKNGSIFQPFETIVEMYGLPNYTELDPTKFVAITAFLMFGFMFGDVGHGAILFLIGLIMAYRKIKLGPILSLGGISSILFGLLYGSVFGKESILPKLLIRPMENIQTMLIASISLGAMFIIIAMIINIINGVKNHDKSRVFFDANGIAGLVFYAIVLIAIVEYILKGKLLASGFVLMAAIGIPLLLILFKDTLTKWIDHKKEVTKTPFIEKIFEMVEMLLSFASNTISFVRLGAFAINHVGLCMAIYILSGMIGGAGNIVVTMIGNGIVIVLEGLIVGIQVLRLEYYELFSRFYQGDGKEYEPIQIEEIKE